MVNQAHGVPSHFSSQRGSLVQGNFNELGKEGTFWSFMCMNACCRCKNLCVMWTGHVMEETKLKEKWNSCEFKTRYARVYFNGKIICTLLVWGWVGGKLSIDFPD